MDMTLIDAYKYNYVMLSTFDTETKLYDTLVSVPKVLVDRTVKFLAWRKDDSSGRSQREMISSV